MLRTCPKFSGTGVCSESKKDSIEYENEDDSKCENSLFTTPTKLETKMKKAIYKGRPTGVKKSKSSSAKPDMADGLRSLAATMHDKNNMRDRELRLRCISLLAVGEEKTELLWEFLQKPRKSDKNCCSIDSAKLPLCDDINKSSDVQELDDFLSVNDKPTKVSIVEHVNDCEE